MIKIKVYKGTTYTVTEVTENVYKIIERKVIESATETIEMQILLKETSFTLPKLMENYITYTIFEEATQEYINSLNTNL